MFKTKIFEFDIFFTVTLYKICLAKYPAQTLLMNDLKKVWHTWLVCFEQAAEIFPFAFHVTDALFLPGLEHISQILHWQMS